MHRLASRIVLFLFFVSLPGEILVGWRSVVGHCLFYAFLWTMSQRVADRVTAP